MTRFLTIFFGTLLLLVAPLAADEAAGAGTVISVVGHPKISEDQGSTFQDIKLGQSVEVGSIIRTESGKVSLLMSEGSTVRLAPNTEITLKEHDPAQDQGGTIFALAEGFARFLVSKVKPGNHFEVQTSNAVAAVKGTDFEAGIDGGKTQVWVFTHDNLGKILFSDLKQLQKILIAEGGYGSFDGNAFDHGTFNPKDQKDSDGRYNGLAAPSEPPAGANNNNPKGDGSPTTPNTQAPPTPLAADITNSITQSISQQFAELADGIKTQIKDQTDTNATIAGEKETSDIVLQRLVVDSNGDQDLVTQIVVRPSANTVDNLTTNYRSSGVNVGSTTMSEVTAFNAALPDDWIPAFEAAVNPTLYRTSQEFLLENPIGNVFEVITVYQSPTQQTLVETAGPKPYLQSFDQLYYSGASSSSLSVIGELSVSAAGLAGSYIAGTYELGLGDTWTIGQPEPTSNNNGYDYIIADVNSVGSFTLTESLIAIGNSGTMYQSGTLDGTFELPSDFWVSRPGGNDSGSYPGEVPGFVGTSSYNVDMNFSGLTGWGANSADIVFLNGFFDTYDMNYFQNNDTVPSSGPPP
jgi:hypothetical protein